MNQDLQDLTDAIH